MRYGTIRVILLPLYVTVISGCASHTTWVPQPSQRPMVTLDAPADAPAPEDAITALMTSAASHVSVPAKATGQVVGSTLVYPKHLASTYPIVTKVHHTTTLIFPMGERLTGDITGGKEQVRYQPYPEAEVQSAPAWVISPGSSGEGDATHLQVDITPIAPNLQTTIVVRTTGGWYVLDVTSKAKGYYPMVAFWQPTPSPQARHESFAVPVSGVIGLGYEILTAVDDIPAWTPVAVWDNQALTVFQFHQGLAQGEAPELYRVTRSGERTLVNTTPKGQRYLVAHTLNQAWELKLGATLVRIQQTPAYGAVTCPNSPLCPTTIAAHVKGAF